jgi:hypothetical protein
MVIADRGQRSGSASEPDLVNQQEEMLFGGLIVVRGISHLQNTQYGTERFSDKKIEENKNTDALDGEFRDF